MSAVTVRLLGGLGNQMFQYAVGRAVAARHGACLRLDPSYICFESHRSYALEPLKVQADVTRTWWPARHLIHHREFDQATAKLRFRARAYRERHYEYDEAIRRVPDDVYLMGYWQSERYFDRVAGQIREELRPKALSQRAQQLATRIEAASPSVSVHVRRGDYVSNPTTTRLHGLLDADYYNRAARMIAERIGEATYFVFSDDPAWCRANLDLPGNSLVVSGETAAYEDVHLISLCDHSVTANSSFSWWGSWLGEGPDTIVVAPKNWFAEFDLDTRDLVPSRWLST